MSSLLVSSAERFLICAVLAATAGMSLLQIHLISRLLRVVLGAGAAQPLAGGLWWMEDCGEAAVASVGMCRCFHLSSSSVVSL